MNRSEIMTTRMVAAPGPEEPPATVHQTTANIVTAEPVQIIVGQQSSDLWHKTLHALWDDRIIAEMTDDAYRVFGAYMRLRHTDTGLATASISELMRMTGRSRTYVYRGRQRIVDNPNSLLVERQDLGRDTYHVLPGWAFRSRVPARGFSSQLGDGSVPARGFSSQLGDASKEVKIPDGILDDELVGMLEAGNPALPGPAGRGFDPRDARGLLTETKATRADVVTACRNADAMARLGDPSKRLRDWRAYIAKQLRSGVTLFSTLQRQDDETHRNWELVRRLLKARGDTDEARAVAGWWNGLTAEQRARALIGAERARTDEWIWGAMVAKASRSRR